MRRAADNRRLNTASTYTEWRTIASEIDERDGAARRWKLQFESPHYDYVLVHERLKDLQKARHLNDWARSACVVTPRSFVLAFDTLLADCCQATPPACPHHHIYHWYQRAHLTHPSYNLSFHTHAAPLSPTLLITAHSPSPHTPPQCHRHVRAQPTHR
jgi:hypothetical protein